MIIARVQTDNFTFEAAGRDGTHALEVLIAGMKAHGQEYRVPDPEGWFYYYLGEDNEEVKFSTLEPGVCLRDREPILRPTCEHGRPLGEDCVGCSLLKPKPNFRERLRRRGWIR